MHTGVLVHAGAELGGGDALAAAAPHAAGLRAAAAPHRLRLRRLVPPPVVVVGLDQPRAPTPHPAASVLVASSVA
eukprot:121186-Rhodomonas_salina.2